MLDLHQDIALACSHLSAAYREVDVLFGIDFEVKRGTLHCITGENGAGKSTLLRVISKLHLPSAGTVSIAISSVTLKPLSLGLVLQHDVLPFAFTIEAILQAAALAGINRLLSDAEVAGILSKTGVAVPANSLISSLSLSQRQQVQIACCIAKGAELYLLDEPTSVMTPVEALHFWSVLKGLRAVGTTIVVVTHNLDDIVAYSDSVTVLKAGAVSLASRTDKVTAAMLVDMMAPDVDPNRPSRTQVLPAESAVTIGTIYKNKVAIPLLETHVHGLAGIGNCGYDDVLTAVALTPVEGVTVTINGACIDKWSIRKRRCNRIYYLSDERHRDVLSLTSSLYLNSLFGVPVLPGLGQGFIPTIKTLSEIVTQIVETFHVYPKNPALTVQELSGGNQQKFALGRELSRDAVVCVLNRPTRGLDRISTLQLALLIRERCSMSGASVLLYSDDIPFLLACCDQITTLRNGEIVDSQPASSWTPVTLVGSIT